MTTDKNRNRTAEQLLHDRVQIGLDSAKARRLIAAHQVEAEFKNRRETTKRNLSVKIWN